MGAFWGSHAHNVCLVDAQRHAHQHLLRPLGRHPVEPQQVRLLQCLVAEEVVLVVPLVAAQSKHASVSAGVGLGGRRRTGAVFGKGGIHDRRIETILVRIDDPQYLVRDERRLLSVFRVDVPVQRGHNRREVLVCHLVQVGDGDPRREARIVGVLRCQVRRRLGRKVVQRHRRDAIVDTLDHLLRDRDRGHVLSAEAVAQLVDTRRDLVECHLLRAPITLHHVHGAPVHKA